MGSRGSSRIGVLLVAVSLVAAACMQPVASLSPSSPPTAGPSGTPSPTTAAVASPTVTDPATTAPTIAPTVEPTAEPTVDPTGPPPSLPCPTARLLNVREFVQASWQCFAGRDVRIKGWLDTPPPFGYEGPAIYPLWLAYPESRQCAEHTGCSVTLALWQDVPVDDDHMCSSDEAYCSLVFPHTPPGSELHFGPLERWLILTGHTDDPAAQRCHYEDPPGEDLGTLDDADAVAHCQREFVVTEIDVVDSP
jgi:hypothetical protein